MDIKAYIASGILELYVAGALSEKENAEVYALMQKHPEILQEVQDIEAAIIKLTGATAQRNADHILESVKQELGITDKSAKVMSLPSPKYNWITYTGWAASILLAVGLFWSLNRNKQLAVDIQVSKTQQSLLETQIEQSKLNLKEANTLIAVLRDDSVSKIQLAGQANFEQTYANVYWDKAAQRIYLDAEGLPEPPKGKVYQVWSLTLNPLTPTSLGTIDDFTTDANKIFEIQNANASEAFGITLEPEGGSASPTMEQLYTLGLVSS